MTLEQMGPQEPSVRRLRSFARDGLRFQVTDTGPNVAPVVVLLHGFPQRASSWAKVAHLLNDQGLRTLAPDQRGYSPDARPRSRAAYALPRLIADVVELVGLIGRPVHLVGHDWGAVVAWAFASERPELLASLTTVSVPHPRAYVRSLVGSAQALRSWYIAPFQLPLLPEYAARSSPRLVEAALRHSGMPGDAIARFRHEILDDGALGTALAWYRAIPLRVGRSAAAAIHVPTTHVWSDQDAALSRRGAELTGRYVQAPYRLEVMEGFSHWVPDEAPDQLAAVIKHRVESASSPRQL
jgi:pimeloyl-ACP methyl ester carboxylesterase